MSYQIPSQNPSTPPNDTNTDQDYEYAPKSDEPVFIQNKQGFKRRAINSQNNNLQPLETNEKDDNVFIVEAQNAVFTEGSPRSAELIVDVSEKSGYMGMSYPGADDSGMFNLRAIINEAKRSEGRFYERIEIFNKRNNILDDGNYGDNENNDMNIMIQDDGREAEDEEEPERHRFERVPSKIRKTENQGVEIDFTTEESVEKEGTHYLGQEPKTPTGLNNEGMNHSKSSYLSGPVRYSKMPEEEAATIFEQRRKELLGNLVKKGRRKHLRIFQDNVDSNSARAISDINAHSVKAKPTSPGFVIYNTRNPSLNKPRMESPPPSLKKKEEIAKTTASTATMRPNASARNTKARAGSSMTSNAEKKESAPVLPPSKAQHVQPKIKASSSEARNLMNKRPISSREAPSFFKNQQKKEEPKVIVNLLKNSKNSREKRMTIEEIDEPRAPKRETPFSPSELETPQETIETKESAVKQSGGAYKNREIWAEIEDLDQQIYELEQAKDIEEVKEFEAREHEVKSGGWKKAKRDVPVRREEDEDRREMLLAASESREKERERTSSRNEGQYSNAWGRNDENSERRISDRYKLASDDLLIEQDSDIRYSNYLPKNEGGENYESATKTLHYGDENVKNSSFSYRTFSEKRTTHRHEMLYQKAMEKKEQRQVQHENMKKERELAEMRKCTFSPDLMRTNRMEFDEDFNTRLKAWQKEKERKIEEIEKKKQEKEMEECTFTPSHNLGKTQISKNEADDFYKRNMEWKQKVEGLDTKKRDEYLKLCTLSGEKPRNKQSVDNRPTHDSMNATGQERFIKTQTLFHSGKEPTKKPYPSTSSVTNRSYSKKRGEENKTAAQSQPTDVSGLKRFNITKTQKSRTHTAEDDFLKRVEHQKGNSELTETNEILDLLKQVVSTSAAKSDKGDGIRMKGTSQSPRRKGKSFNPSSSGTLKFDNNKPLDTLTLNTLESTGPIGKGKNVSNDVPFLSNEHTSADLKSNAENIVIKNNKYYITKKLKSPSSTAKNPHDTDKKEDIPSMTYTLNSRMKSGSKNESKSQQMRGYSPKRDQENSHVPQKLVYNKQKDTPTMTNLFDDQSPTDLFKEQRTPLGDREMNNNNLYESPRMKNNENYGKNENKEVNPSLERKFMDLINQVSRVTQQLDTIRPPTAGGSSSGGQNENLSSKRRRINFSLY